MLSPQQKYYTYEDPKGTNYDYSEQTHDLEDFENI